MDKQKEKEIRKETAERFRHLANTAVNIYKSPVGGNDYVVNAERMIFEINQICKELGGE